MAKRISIKNPNSNPEMLDEWVDTRGSRKRFTLDLPVSLHKKLKIAAAKREETMAEIICRILEEQLRETD